MVINLNNYVTHAHKTAFSVMGAPHKVAFSATHHSLSRMQPAIVSSAQITIIITTQKIYKAALNV